jgi:hypothetical protein
MIQNGKEKLSKPFYRPIFWQEIKMILWKTRPKKSSAPFRPFFDKSGKSSAPDFPGLTKFCSPFLSFAAEISAPWQHW